MNKVIGIAMLAMVVLTLFCGSVMAGSGDEMEEDHSADDSQPGYGDIGPGEPVQSEEPTEDRTRNH